MEDYLPISTIMPEPYWPKRKGAYLLSDAHAARMLICVRCPYDKRERWYEPAELKRAYGNVEVDDLMFMMKCRCGGAVDVKGQVLSAEARQKVTMRRLVQVYYERRHVWRDEKP